MRKLSVISLLVTSLVALPVAAHHGWSSYDNDKPLTLTGNVVEAPTPIRTGPSSWTPAARPGSRCWRRRRGCRPGTVQ